MDLNDSVIKFSAEAYLSNSIGHVGLGRTSYDFMIAGKIGEGINPAKHRLTRTPNARGSLPQF